MDIGSTTYRRVVACFKLLSRSWIYLGQKHRGHYHTADSQYICPFQNLVHWDDKTVPEFTRIIHIRGDLIKRLNNRLLGTLMITDV